MDNLGNDSVQSVKRALDIIEVLAESKEDLGVTQIAKLAGLSKTTAFRLLNTLIQAGYVQKGGKESDYRLSVKFLTISSSILERQDIRNIAKPHLKNLLDATKEIVHLAILDMDEVVYIDKLESNEHAIRIFSTVGKRSPLHCTGLGKVFMSGMPEEHIDKIVAQKGLKKYTENTITDIHVLKKELEIIRKRGYAFDEMEHEIGVWCIAAPIFDRNGRTAAAISVTAPKIYMPDEKIPLLVNEVKTAVNNISYLLGYIK